MARLVLFSALLILCFHCGNSQTTLLEYTWETLSNADQPDTGPGSYPTGYSISSSAGISTPGNGGGKGLNPGVSCGICNNFCYTNPVLTVPNTSNIFDEDELDFSIDYRLDSDCPGTGYESEAWFYSRSGSNFYFGMKGGKLAYRYSLDTVGGQMDVPDKCGAGTYRQCWGCDTELTDGIIPQDGVWHTYKFSYRSADGYAKIYVDGTLDYSEVCSHPGGTLYWASAGEDLVIAETLDGEGNDISQLDNVLVEKPTSLLPVELGYFMGEVVGLNAYINWSTVTETGSFYFTIEKWNYAKDQFTSIGNIAAAGTSSNHLKYSFTDFNLHKGSNRYRLVQTDLDGKTQIFQTIELDFNYTKTGLIALYPNPIGKQETLHLQFSTGLTQISPVKIFDKNGICVLQERIEIHEGLNRIELSTRHLLPGIYQVQIRAHGKSFGDKFLKVY